VYRRRNDAPKQSGGVHPINREDVTRQAGRRLSCQTLYGMRTLLSILLVFAICGCASSQVWVSFWPTEIKPPANVKTREHPCGPVLDVKTNVVPNNEKWLETNVVHEIDESGLVLRTWNIPIDYYPVAVIGDKLHLAFGSRPRTIMTIDLNGRLGVVHSPPLHDLETRECPAAYKKDFYCSIISSNPLRMLASMPVCT